MIERNVPILSSLWSGTGTVVVPVPSWRCITMWLDRPRTSAKPCRARMLQASRPDTTRSLPNGHLNVRHKHIPRQSSINLLSRRHLEEEFQRLPEIVACVFDGVALTGDVEFGAQGYVAISLTFNECGQTTRHHTTLHGSATIQNSFNRSVSATEMAAGRTRRENGRCVPSFSHQCTGRDSARQTARGNSRFERR